MLALSALRQRDTASHIAVDDSTLHALPRDLRYQLWPCWTSVAICTIIEGLIGKSRSIKRTGTAQRVVPDLFAGLCTSIERSTVSLGVGVSSCAVASLGRHSMEGGR